MSGSSVDTGWMVNKGYEGFDKVRMLWDDKNARGLIHWTYSFLHWHFCSSVRPLKACWMC